MQAFFEDFRIQQSSDFLTHIRDHAAARMAELAHLCEIPSVASDRTAVDHCVDQIGRALRERGFRVEVLPTAGNPAVYAEQGDGSQTLLLYNHYDVQPADPVSAWQTPPFQPQQRNGSLFARGAIDDKGELVARFAAIDALLAKYGSLPLRIKLLIEGEEETGSQNLEPLLQRERERLRSQGCIWEAGSSDAVGRPEIWLGVRGELYVELTVRTLNRDAHSGSAHILPNAAWRLLRALATLKDENEKILIEHFYDDVKAPTPAQQALLAKLDVEDEFRREYGVERFVAGRSGLALAAAVFQPTCNICGVWSGYTEEGTKTVIPSQASAKIDFRLVPDQDPATIEGLLRRHLDTHGFEDVQVRTHSAQIASVSDPGDPFVQLAIDAARDTSGLEPVVYPLIGGTGPAALFTRHLQVPFVSLGCAYPGSRKHAPDEHIRVQDFIRGADCIATLMDRVAHSPAMVSAT
ncbi:MAG TPA: M20/M25/M40 family metallo-hydrolase [Candidatus Eremiobacteraceae bacterium]|nr:M20/M25/M40 family metallo-hydrolase [Candidatus Eremiobacteraceae bacterium]